MWKRFNEMGLVDSESKLLAIAVTQRILDDTVKVLMTNSSITSAITLPHLTYLPVLLLYLATNAYSFSEEDIGLGTFLHKGLEVLTPEYLVEVESKCITSYGKLSTLIQEWN